MDHSPIVKSLLEHYEQIDRQSEVMHEWPGSPEVFWSPVTLNDRNKANEKTGVGKLMMVVIQKAEDSSGNKMFTRADFQVLMAKTDGEPFIRLANKMLGAKDESEAGND